MKPSEVVDYEHLSPQGGKQMDHPPASGKPISARTVIDALAVAAILWVGNNIQAQNVSLAKLQEQVTGVQATLAGVPQISKDVATAQAQLLEFDRRLGVLERLQQNAAATMEFKRTGAMR